MTQNQLAELAGYFCNPVRISLLEIEIPEANLKNYILKYQSATTNVSFPSLPNNAVYIVPPDKDKWGREMRLYFYYDENNSLPTTITHSVTIGGRQGYDAYNKRLNSKDIIDPLIEWGFVLGPIQNESRIRSRIPANLIADFDIGYLMP